MRDEDPWMWILEYSIHQKADAVTNAIWKFLGLHLFYVRSVFLQYFDRRENGKQ